MSTGMFTFSYLIDSIEHPVRPPGHPRIPFHQWRQNTGFLNLRSSSPQLIDGLCGAPFVEVETGNVAGLFHLTNGDWAEYETLDGLVEGG